jgi:S-DNA-T family DNA segregation ATPase FtsK/SpoIIIE
VRTGLDDCELPPARGIVAKPAASNVELPEIDILDDPEPFEHHEHEQAIRERARILERTFAEFQMKVRVVQIDTGPVVTQYEIELEPGLRARKVMALSDDIAIALKAQNVRIVAPIPGKNTVGVEVPNETRARVSLKEVMLKAASASGSMRLPMFLGKDVKGQPMVHDLAAMPHLLIAGRTGTGKSVCLNSLILSMLMTRSPDQVKMLMIDPKMVELSLYRSIPHLLHPVVTDMKKAEAILAWAVEKMEERYALLARAGVRHIDSYNALGLEEIHARLGVESEEEKAQIPAHMPYILIFADEMADLMMTAAKEVEAHIIRLAQKSRAVGIHLVLATQKPTVDVITGLIKSNLPARIAFQVASRMDSRVVLDEMGADKLLGNGDMLFLYPGTSKITRAQGTFVSDAEVTRVVEHLSRQAKPQFSEEIAQFATAPRGEAAGGGANLSHRDELYEAAVEVVVREQRGSVSLLQRALGIGYGRAARLIDYMAEDGIVGEYQGAQAREVLYAPDQWEELRNSRFARAG